MTAPSFESKVDCSLLSMSTACGGAVIENSSELTDGKSLIVTCTGSNARLRVEISVTVTLDNVGGGKYRTDDLKVDKTPL
jgi:hypothetical protein